MATMDLARPAVSLSRLLVLPSRNIGNNMVGSLAMYFEQPHDPSPVDLELAAAFTQTAGIIIWRHLEF
jgi:two-component system CheB/CheR fusion protein